MCSKQMRFGFVSMSIWRLVITAFHLLAANFTRKHFCFVSLNYFFSLLLIDIHHEHHKLNYVNTIGWEIPRCLIFGNIICLFNTKCLIPILGKRLLIFLSCGRTIVTNPHYHFFLLFNTKTPNDIFISHMVIDSSSIISRGYVYIFYKIKFKNDDSRHWNISIAKRLEAIFSATGSELLYNKSKRWHNIIHRK